MKLTAAQYEQLLKPVSASRIAQRNQAGITLSYLEAWDVKAHLIRIFGFGGWSADVLSAELAYEDKDEKGRWAVGYRVVMRLSIHPGEDPLYVTGATYTEAAVGSATLPQRGEAHDMAIKTAESDALKRAAINLGTQFGLSLYDNGNRNDVVKATLLPPADFVPASRTETPVSVEKQTDEGANDLVAEAEVCETREGLKEIWDMAVEANWLDTPITSSGAATTLRQIIIDRLAEIGQ